jgi:hypothetical protein
MQNSDLEPGPSGYAARLLLGLISRVHRRLTAGGQGALPITALTRKTAIIEIFRSHWADEVGTRLSLIELMSAWNDVGLRADDLALGLNEMLEDGSLTLDPNYFKPAVTLTRKGKDWLDGVDVDPKVLAEQKQLLALVRERRRTQVPEETKPGEIPHWRIVDRRIRIDTDQEW